jgi:hypothetical protein
MYAPDSCGATLEDVVELVKVYVKGAMFSNAQHTKRQSAGITIGGIPCPQLLNLSLAEVEWKKAEDVVRMMEDDSVKARVRALCGLRFVSRYVDDCIYPQGCEEFLPSSKDYGLELSDVQCAKSVTFGGYRISLAIPGSPPANVVGSSRVVNNNNNYRSKGAALKIDDGVGLYYL